MKQKVVFKLTTEYREKIENLLNKHSIPPDTFDYHAYWDTTLTEGENLREFKRILKISDKIQDVRDEQEKFQEQITQQEREEINKRFNQTIQKIKDSNVAELNTYFHTLYSYTETLIRNNKINGLIFIGKRGIGKTFNLIMKLENLKQQYTVIKGHITPLSVYKTLFEHSNNGIIILDDIVGLLKNDDVLSMLLSALDYDNRVVKWVSQSPLMQFIPNEFVFNGKIIILLNQINMENEFLSALKDRCYTINLDFSNEQIIEMLYILANKRGISYEVVDFLKEMNRASLQNLSLRTLDKTQNIYTTYHNNGEDWRGLAKEMLEYDEIGETFIEIVGDRNSIKEQVREWIERTGYSRRQFFYLKKQLVQKCKVQPPNEVQLHNELF